MARQTYYVTREQKHPLYRTRMLQAGPLELDASAARLYRRLGVDLSEEAPKRAAKVEAPVVETPTTATVDGRVGIDLSSVDEPAPKPAAKKAPAKKAARRKKS